jgi:hypothetical protein
VVIPGGAEHEAWSREDTEVIDFFAPPSDDFLVGGKLAYMSEGRTLSLNAFRLDVSGAAARKLRYIWGTAAGQCIQIGPGSRSAAIGVELLGPQAEHTRLHIACRASGGRSRIRTRRTSLPVRSYAVRQRCPLARLGRLPSPRIC